MAPRLAHDDGGIITWNLTQDDEGHREYKLDLHVITEDPDDGPYNILYNTPGMPLVGSDWQWKGDVDPWAFRRPGAVVTIFEEKEGDPALNYRVQLTYSTRPIKECRDQSFEDPLTEPPRISGSFVKYMEEATHDRWGLPITSSSFEQFRGAQVEFDANRPAVRIEQNKEDLQLGLVASMVDTLNDDDLWGLPPRCIKLSNFTWEKKYYGLCYVYYTRVFEFDVNFKTFDRLLLDEGSKLLNGRWTGKRQYSLINIDGQTPDPMNVAHFDRAKDGKDENVRYPLNGRGLPAGVTVIWDDPNVAGTGTSSFTTEPKAFVRVEKYEESNFLLLDLPLGL